MTTTTLQRPMSSSRSSSSRSSSSSSSGRFIAVVVTALVLVVAWLGQHSVEAQDPIAPAAPPAPAVSAYLGDMCLNNTQCTVLNSACVASGDNTGTMRCRCMSGFYQYDLLSSGKKEELKCGKIQTTATNPQCSACEENQGTCVQQDDGTTGTKTFCQCPISRTGVDCNEIHVNVSCSMDNMTVCYSRHAQVNFTDGWKMFASGHSSSAQCRSTTVAAGSVGACAAGNEQLTLSLNATEMSECGTTSIENSKNKRYMNKIEIQKFDPTGQANDSVLPVVFNVYCSYTAYQDETFDGIGVGRVNGNDQGAQVNPKITISVTDQFDRKIAPGATLIVGDRVKFTMNLTLDGIYGSIQVMRCTASTSAVMPDSTAETRALMDKGCPVPGESTGQYWYWTPTTTNNHMAVKSGAVPIFKMSSSNDVYLHCALKACMVADNTCPTLNQTTCATIMNARRRRDLASEAGDGQSVVMAGRQKRDTTSNVDVQTSLRVADPSSQSVNNGNLSAGSPGFIALLCILGIIAFVLVIAVVFVVVRVKRKRKIVSDSGEPRPQLFALPRIARTHERF